MVRLPLINLNPFFSFLFFSFLFFPLLNSAGIFRVQALHLGHVAKSFGLRESPTNLRNNEDVIGKIFNGVFANLQAVEAFDPNPDKTKKGKEEKQKALNFGSSDMESFIASFDDYNGGLAPGEKKVTVKEKKRIRDEKWAVSKRAKLSQTGKRSDNGAASADEPIKNMRNLSMKKGKDRQKLRKMGTAGSGSGSSSSSGGAQTESAPTASGRFRKTQGYFRKKLRAQSSSEFSAS